MCPFIVGINKINSLQDGLSWKLIGCSATQTILRLLWSSKLLDPIIVKPVINGPFSKRNFVLNGNIFRSRDCHSIPWLKGNLVSAETCYGPLTFRLRQVLLYTDRPSPRTYVTFRNVLYSVTRGRQAHVQPEAGGEPLVGCLRSGSLLLVLSQVSILSIWLQIKIEDRNEVSNLYCFMCPLFVRRPIMSKFIMSMRTSVKQR
jgi:hypothetical protein